MKFKENVLLDFRRSSWGGEFIQVKKLPLSRLVKLTKGSTNSTTRDFTHSKRAETDVMDCLTPHSFVDQVVANCIGLICDRPLFS